MGGMVTPFGFESMPEKWPGSSSTFGRRVKTNCHAEYPDIVKFGKDEINVNLYNKHYKFKQFDDININESYILSTYPQPTYIVKSKSISNGYNILLININGVFQNEIIPTYSSIGKWYPRTWGLLIFDPNGNIVGEYRHITPEMITAAETGITRDNSLQSNINKALLIEFRLDGEGNIKDQFVSKFAQYTQRRRLYLDEQEEAYLFKTVSSADLRYALSILISGLIKDLMPSIIPKDEIFDTQSSIVMDAVREIHQGVQFRRLYFDEDKEAVVLQLFVYPFNNYVAQFIKNIVTNPQFEVILSTALKLTRTIFLTNDPLYYLRPWRNLYFAVETVEVSDIPPAQGLISLYFHF